MIAIDIVSIAQFGALCVLLIGGLEIVLRVKGKKPVKIKKEKSEIIPEGKFTKEHPVLGFIHQTGYYKFHIKNRFNFTAAHDKDGHRITGRKKTASEINGSRPQIWILGCSYTYGWLVDDHETYPWLIQERLPNYKIVNFGVNGYGTLQSYLQYKEAIKTKQPPDLVILGYCDFHKSRNTMERQRKKALSYLERSRPFAVPAARINKNGDLNIICDKEGYIGIPFSSKLSLLDLIENRFNIYHDNNLNSWEVTEKILEKFQDVVEKNGTTFVMAAIHDSEATSRMLRIAHSKGIETIDISVDRSKNSPEHTYIPYDSHPSPLAHKKYAENLTQYLIRRKLVHP